MVHRVLLWPTCVAYADNFRPVVSILLGGSLCGLSTNLECRSEMCCTRLAGNAGRKQSSSAHSRTTLSGCIFASKACIDNQKTSC